MNRRSVLALTLAAPALLRAGAAPAQGAATQGAEDFPRRPVRMIVPFPAGGTSDVIVRYVAGHLSTVFGQPFVVDNRVGANGTIGLAQGLRAAPDGHTLIQVSNTNTVAAVHMIRNLPFDPLRDMAGIGSVYQIPTAVMVGPAFPAGSFAELLALVRASPGRYSFAYSHATGAVVGHSLLLAGQLDMVPVPYRSGPQMMNDLLGGQIPIVVTDVGIALPLIQSRSIRLLAVSSPERTAGLPDVPTLTEALPKPIAFVGWGGFVAPAATPRPIVARLNAEMNRILETPAADSFLRDLGAERMTGTAEGFDAFIQREAQPWADGLKAARIEPE
ncbi:Bug family tripartite tricarboxylate transporter substrate binding protein [Roseomonas sp. BN140053]|uniref:Bug family tripartite tricarboxylate transporter substrate binding protein n=1 Tax=Roseomonas sp. BN140053 TaxID=3391898 RepID=UPI0039EADE40